MVCLFHLNSVSVVFKCLPCERLRILRVKVAGCYSRMPSARSGGRGPNFGGWDDRPGDVQVS
jgi:hypothetical protein